MDFFKVELRGRNIITSPHSSYIRYDSIYRGSSDRGINLIAKELSKKLDFTLILPVFSRFIVDFNKPKDEAILKTFKTYVIPKPSEKEIKKRLMQYEKYYENLLKLAKDAKFHISIHSMFPVGKRGTIDEGIIRPDFRFGTLNGKTCSRELINKISNEFEKGGFSLEIDNVFLGGEEIRQTCKFDIESIQIEINSKYILDFENDKIDEKKVKDITQILVKIFQKCL